MLSEEQQKQIKDQLLKQAENLPPGQKDQIKAEINSMNSEQLEQFIKQNSQQQNPQQQNSPFRQIVDGKIPSYKIAENEDAIAVLEINPISKGHTIILQKSPKTNPSEKTQQLVTQTGALLKEKLNPKNVTVKLQETLGETIINLLPVYKEETLDSPKSSASKEELKKTQEQIISKTPEPKKEKPKPKKTPLSKLPKAPKRQA